MKKIIPITLLATIIFTFSLFVTNADASGGVVKEVNSKTAVVRSDANNSAEKLVTLSKGYLVVELSSLNGWSKVKVGKTTGYMRMDVLKAKTFNRKVLKTLTDVKLSASFNSQTLTTLPKGIIVENYISTKNGWSFVKIGDVSGYVRTNNFGTTRKDIKYTINGSSMYELPNSGGDYIGFVEASKKVTVLTTVDNNAYIKVGSKYGYISNLNLVQHMVFAKSYMPKCENVKTKDIKCRVNKNGGSFIYKNIGENKDDILGDYYIEGDNLIVRYFESESIIDFPLYKLKNWSYELSPGKPVYSTVLSVNEEVNYKGKKLKNVVKIEEFHPGYGTQYSYLAPGYGFIKVN